MTRHSQLYAKWNIEKQTVLIRMMWYQTGPYFAYYYSARYQDVINLANTTLNDTISTPTWKSPCFGADVPTNDRQYPSRSG